MAKPKVVDGALMGAMAQRVGPAVFEPVIEDEDLARARIYQLLSSFLARPPSDALLADTTAMEGDDSRLGQGLCALASAAQLSDQDAAEREYNALFIGLGRGELVPYASYYLTGFLNEKPLARLRVDMSRLGIGRASDVSEPEDHAGALCEMMAGLITGRFGPPLDLVGQKAFFDVHMRRWMGRFFEDLEEARNAHLYRPVGTIGRALLDVEETAFEMI